MADRKISDLTALTAPASGDFLPIVDISEAAAATKNKRITIEELMRGMPDGTAAAPGIAFENDPNTGIYSPGADQVAISTNGTGRLFVDASGNIGVANGSPACPLDVTSPTANSLASRFGNVAGRGLEISTFIQSGTNDAGTILNAKGVGNGTFVIQTDSSEKLRITSAGNVGIGTTVPNGWTNASPALAVVNSNTTAYSATSFAASPNLILAGGSASGAYNAIRFTAAGNNEVSFGVVQEAGGAGAFVFQGYSGSAYSERLRIDSSGRVGIGTPSPAAGYITTMAGSSAWITAGANFTIEPDAAAGANGVDLKTSFTAGGNGPLKIWTANTERLRIDTSGRVGIGTSSPGANSMLTVFNASNASYRAQNNVGGAAVFGVTDSASSEGFINASNAWRLRVNDTTCASLTSTGLGIGTPSPDAPLHVKATAGSTSSVNTGLIVNYESTGPTTSGGGTGIKFKGSSGGGGTADYDQAQIATSTTGTNNDHGLDFYTRRNAAAGLTKRFSIDDNGGIRNYAVAATPVAIFGFESSEAARIDSLGRLLVGTSTAVDQGLVLISYSGGVNQGAIFADTNATSGNNAIRFKVAGATVGSITTTSSATAYNTSSDYRLKENVTAVTDGITRLQQLKPSRFNFIANPDHTVDGFIAHEVQAVVPEAITGEKDAVDAEGNPIYQGIDQSKLVPLLTAALQEAIAKIETLEARLTAAGIE